MRGPGIACLAVAVLAAAAPAAADPRLESGKRDFMALCSTCHGQDGKGHGPAASPQHPPADLTRIPPNADGTFPATLVFRTISGLDMPGSHGKRDMPVWGDIFLSEAIGDSVDLKDAARASEEAARRIANLVRYIESIQTHR